MCKCENNAVSKLWTKIYISLFLFTDFFIYENNLLERYKVKYTTFY